MRRLIVLRPEPGASATLRRALERGLDAVAVPLFEIEALAWDAPDPRRFDALLLTSANALRHGGEALGNLRGLPVHAVGEATAVAAREAGFAVATVGERGVESLLDSVEPGQRLLHLCGEDRRVPQTRSIESIAIYRAKAIVAPDLSCAPGSVSLIHSPRAGRRFAEWVTERQSIAIAAISPAAAEAVGAGWESVEAVAESTDDALLALATRLCNNPSPK